MSDLLEVCRWMNGGLAFFVTMGLAYRTPQALQGVASKRLYLVLAAFPMLAGFASAQAVVLHAPLGPMTPVFTVAYMALAWVLLRWPPQLQRNVTA